MQHFVAVAILTSKEMWLRKYVWTLAIDKVSSFKSLGTSVAEKFTYSQVQKTVHRAGTSVVLGVGQYTYSLGQKVSKTELLAR